MILVDVHRATLPNVAVKDIELHSAGPVTGVPIQVTVSLQGDPSVEEQRHIELLLDGQDTFFGTKDLRLIFLELFGYIAFGINQGLLADPIFGNFIFMGVSNFNIVPKNVIRGNF